MGRLRVDCLPFVTIMSVAPRISPSDPVMTSFTLPNLHRVCG